MGLKFKYVGDGYTWINGKNPDFINFDSKLIIELYSKYWHPIDDSESRRRHFEQYGYKTLIIWENELKKKDSLKKKIYEFTK